MIGDLILVKQTHKKKAKTILSNLKSKNKIVGIGGISSIGKTEISYCLQELLYNGNRSSLRLSLDDHYNTYFGERMRIRRKKGLSYIGIKEIEWAQLKKIVAQFRARKDTVQIQQINKFTNSYSESIVYNVNKIDYLIIEGLFAGHLKKLKCLDYYVHLEGSIEETKEFRLERMKENEKDKFRQKIVKKEANVVAQLKRYADLVIGFSGKVK